MAAGPLLRSESLTRYRALGTAGDPIWRAAGQLRAAIAQRLTQEHADLLALPEVDPTGRRIDWYAPFEGDARRLSEIDEAERAPLLERVRKLHADISRLAELLDEPQRSSAERNFARLLRHALSAPGEETLHVVAGRPVMTFWGFATDTALPGAFLASPPAVLPRPVAVAAPAAVLASAPAAALAMGPRIRTAWWQWLLLAALLLLILAALAWLIRPYLPHLEPRLAAEARDRAMSFAQQQPVEFQHTRVASLLQDNEALRLELARLSEEAARRGGDCAAGVVVPGGAIVGVGPGTGVASGAPIERGAASDVKPDAKATDAQAPDAKPDPTMANKPDDKAPMPPPPGGPDDKNVADKGSMKAPDAQEKDKAANKDLASKDKKDEPKPMVVPPEARQKQEIAFMKGDWRSRTGLATATGEKDLRPSYTLDDKGKGKVSFVQSNGATCEAPAEARWDKDKLIIEEKSNPKCSDGRTYARNTINCAVGADGAAQCSGSQPGDKRTYNVQIGR